MVKQKIAITFLTRRMLECVTKAELETLWNNINPAYHKELTQVKDELKLKLKRK